MYVHHIFLFFLWGVGSTTLVGNLRYLLAKEGFDVILVDFNLQSPFLSLNPDLRVFPESLPENSEGLLGFLRRGVNLSPILDIWIVLKFN